MPKLNGVVVWGVVVDVCDTVRLPVTFVCDVWLVDFPELDLRWGANCGMV